MKLALLATVDNSTVVSRKVVEVADDHDFAKGPYQDTVPFAVGSNQYLEEADDVFARAYNRWLELDLSPDLYGEKSRLLLRSDEEKPWWLVVDGLRSDVDMQSVSEFETEEELLEFVKEMRWPMVNEKWAVLQHTLCQGLVPVSTITEDRKPVAWAVFDTYREAQLDVLDVLEEFIRQFRDGEDRSFDEVLDKARELEEHEIVRVEVIHPWKIKYDGKIYDTKDA